MLATVLVAIVVAGTAGHARAAPRPTLESDGAGLLGVGGWVWPVEKFRLERPFEAPAHDYGPGHRGIDVRPVGSTEVRAPAPGTIAFAGDVAGRGVLTMDHGGGLVTTLEPVTPGVEMSAAVEGGALVALLATGGHTAAGALHVGVRLHGEYINPLLLLGGPPRAVLLPCC